ncbi:acyl-coenzyme A diphosphatase FITM2 [Eucyclogobius newberryi]|uniref:acyl-coenzyme A diphosphatase FITM2 n=1 Tax=Eucyclogobius newberryi TaxID=166745 RepID=UPI003B5D03C5
MAALDVIVDKLVSFWRIPGSRRYFPAVFLLICVAGSWVKDAQLVPDTYFSSSKNVINLYFVKVSWGWTLLLLAPFVLLSNASFGRGLPFLTRRLLALPVATAVWYLFTEAFLRIEEATGSCFQTTGVAMELRSEFSSRAGCRSAGLHWLGRDVSGHSFILAYAALFIVEETAPMGYLRNADVPAVPRLLLGVLYVALNGLVLLWVWMFCCTSLYFHQPLDKLLGTLCALLAWYSTYRLWYLQPLSPGLPPRQQTKEQKQHA